MGLSRCIYIYYIYIYRCLSLFLALYRSTDLRILYLALSFCPSDGLPACPSVFVCLYVCLCLSLSVSVCLYVYLAT